MRVVKAELCSVPSMSGQHVLSAVLTQDDAGKFAAYLGIVNDATTPGGRRMREEWVAYNGVKLTLKQARSYFPSLTEKEYRR